MDTTISIRRLATLAAAATLALTACGGAAAAPTFTY